MRARRTMRVPTAAKVAVGASVLAFPATAMAVTSQTTAAAPVPRPVPLHDVHTSETAYGAETIVRGTAPALDAGTRLELEYRPAEGRAWRTVDHGSVRANGTYVLIARIGRSGALQVKPTFTPILTGPAVPIRPGARPSRVFSSVGSGPPSEAPESHGTISGPQVSATDPSGTSLTGSTGTNSTGLTGIDPAVSDNSGLSASPVSRIWVRPQLALARRSQTAIAGQSTEVTGRLLPGIAGRQLELQVQDAGHWVRVATARTQSGGAFGVRFTPAAAGHELTRVIFSGDRLNAGTQSAVDSVSEMQYAEVSWYDDAGDTACGFHATYGIASRTLPCGTKVTMSYAGHTVVATVDDRGPFVYSRLYDLDQNTAAALGMDGVQTVLASV